MKEDDYLAAWRQSVKRRPYHQPALECGTGAILSREMIEDDYLAGAVARIMDRYSAREMAEVLSRPIQEIKAALRRIKGRHHASIAA